MRRYFVYILLICIILPAKALCVVDSNAGFCISDSIKESKELALVSNGANNKSERQNRGFDVNRYAYQKRYLWPDKIRFSNKKRVSHFYFGFGAGLGHICKREKYNYGLGYDYSVFIGKDLEKNHAIALVARMGRNKIRKSDVEMEMFALQANYYFHFTRYFFGYNPDRLFEMSSLLAAGYQHSDIWNDNKSSIYGLIGFKAALRVSNHMHLALEPYAILASRGYNGMSRYTSTRNYNVAYGATLLLNYTLHNELTESLPYIHPIYDRQYIFFEGGIQPLLSNISFASSIGNYTALGYGYMFSQYFGLRATVGYSDSKWSRVVTAANVSAGHPEYIYFSKSRYMFGRAEAVLDLLAAPLKAENNKKWFSLGITAGYENGFMWKFTDTEAYNALNYGGPTMSVLAKFHLSHGMAVYLSPRVTFANYAIPYKRPYDYIKKKYTDTKFNFAMGFEFGLNKRTYIGDKEILFKASEFTRSMFVSASFGINTIMTKGGYSGKVGFNKNASLSYEYRPHKIFGARMKLSYVDHQFAEITPFTEYLDNKTFDYNGLCSITYGMATAILDARVDISNLIYGYNFLRRWNSSFYVGPMISMQTYVSGKLSEKELTLPGSTVVVNKKRCGGVFPGGHVALNSSYLLSSRWSIFGEFSANIHARNYLDESCIWENFVCTFKYELGVSLRIK